MGGEGRSHPDPPSLSLFSLHDADCRGLATAYPQYPVVVTKPLQHAPKAAAPGIDDARRQNTLRRPPTGRPCPRPPGLLKPPPIMQLNSPHSQLAPRHPLFLPFALIRSSRRRRRATGRARHRRVRPPLGKRMPGSGGGVPPESFPPLAVKPCFLYARRRRRRLPLWTPVSSLPGHRTRRRRAIGLESNGSIPIRVT
jgi:hypothetical protein